MRFFHLKIQNKKSLKNFGKNVIKLKNLPRSKKNYLIKTLIKILFSENYLYDDGELLKKNGCNRYL
jgi:hypothetical protein